MLLSPYMDVLFVFILLVVGMVVSCDFVGGFLFGACCSYLFLVAPLFNINDDCCSGRTEQKGEHLVLLLILYLFCLRLSSFYLFPPFLPVSYCLFFLQITVSQVSNQTDKLDFFCNYFCYS